MIYSLVGVFFFPFTTTSFISINTQMYVYVITESGGCTLAASKNCKLTILQHSFSMTLKKTIGKKAMPSCYICIYIERGFFST